MVAVGIPQTISGAGGEDYTRPHMPGVESALPKHSPHGYLVMVSDLKHGFKPGTLFFPKPWRKPLSTLHMTQLCAGRP